MSIHETLPDATVPVRVWVTTITLMAAFNELVEGELIESKIIAKKTD